MAIQSNKEKIQAFYRDLCIGLIGSLRALSLYTPEHPEAKKRIANIYQRLIVFLKQRPSLTMLVVNGEIVIENVPLPELSKTLAQFIQRMEDMKFQRFVFKKDLVLDELISFLQLLIQLMKRPESAIEMMAENQGKFHHIIAGVLPTGSGQLDSQDEQLGALQTARQSVISFSRQLKDIFEAIKGPLSGRQVSLAKETTESIYAMNIRGEIPLKVLIYRRTTDSDPYIHAINVCAFSMALAREIGLKDSIVEEVGFGALLHDIGLHMLASGQEDFNSTGTSEGQANWYGHPQRGAELLLATKGIPDLAPLVAYEHHIHYDGGGYHKDIRRRDLNMASMITCITNSYDNLRRELPNKHALTLTGAIDWMDRRFGTQFHPVLFKRFRAMVKAQAKEEI